MSPTSSLNLCAAAPLAFSHVLKHYKAPLTSCSLPLDHSQTSHLLNGVHVYPFFRLLLLCCFLRVNFPGPYHMLFHKTFITYPLHLSLLQFYIYLWNYVMNFCLPFWAIPLSAQPLYLAPCLTHTWCIRHICRMSESRVTVCAPFPLQLCLPFV